LLRLALSLLICTTLAPVSAAAPSNFVPGELLVIRRPGGALETRAEGALGAHNARLAALLARHGLSRWQALGTAPGASGVAGDWVKLVSADPGFDPVAASAELMAAGDVVAAAPNLRLRLYATLPNDPFLTAYQYWIQDPGNADVQIADAWDITRGDTSVVIGVMDTGVDRTHPDLASQIWRNPGEIAGNGVDDDGDGYIDDVNGWDFGGGDADPNPEPFFDEATGIDVGFHGTFVAALASAATDNHVGLAGVGWRCRIMPLKVANAAGEITLEATTAAFRYAWGHHVAVLNMSLGTSDTTARTFFQAMVDSAADLGVVCVAAAGNDGVGAPSFPAACDRVLSVAATDDANARASFSNWGPTVDVAAPGSSMWSAICQNYVVDDFSQVFYLYLWYWDGETPYMYGDGTSFACPVAAGVCALVRARWPYLTPDQVIQQVIATGDAVAYDEPIGRKLNALRAVSQNLLAVSESGLAAVASAWPNPFGGATSIGLALARSGEANVALYDAAGRRVRTLFAGPLTAGTHRLRWDGLDNGGAQAPPGLYFARIQAPGIAGTIRLVRVE
jgi:subtilisin family serine protease